MKRYGDDMKSHDDITFNPKESHSKTLKFELQPQECILWSIRSMSSDVLVKSTWNGKTNTMSPGTEFRDFLRNDHSGAGTLSIRVSCRKDITTNCVVKVKYRVICESETSVDGTTSTLPIAVTVSTDRVSPPPPPTKRNGDVDVDDDGGPKTFVSSRSDILEEI
tara:strand:- start:23 stop:514 length:492 start_codon:yes stop_codon:yes gene_type:complete